MTPSKTPNPGRLRIVSLTAENIKRIEAVHIEPDGSLVQITGANGSGKSSVLDSIWWALQGKGVVQSQPIRKGQDAGMIRIDFGSLIVTRHFRREEDGEYTTSLSVENDEGAIYSSPQKMLDGFLGSLSFDPLAFMEKDGKGKLAELRRIVNLDVDIDELDRLNRGDFERRTQVNRTVRHLQEKVAANVRELKDMGALDRSDNLAAVDTAGLLAEMEQASATNAAIERERIRREGRALEASNMLDRAVRLTGEAESLRKRAAELDAAILEELAKAPALDTPVDVATLRAQVEKANAENARRQTIRATFKRHDDAAEELKSAENEAAFITENMDRRTAEKTRAIAAAKMPVEGLAFGDGDVLWRGIPLDQASTAEQIRVSLAVGMAMNPGLRVILIRQGSLLDDASVEIVRSWAEENDFQVWMERVDTSGKIGIVMEAGRARVAS
jgi:DNA repair exonuclease SbcCD ATPase subunit